MSQLASVIEKAADAFAKGIITAVKAASLQELLALSGGAPRRGGRPPKTVVVAKAKARKRTKKIKWPKCKHRGCKRNAWARGNGMCGEHYKASKARAKA
jgi:predicted NBD/HSP70 family sugar kinase